MKSKFDKEFDLEYQFQTYVDLMRLSDLSPGQKDQLKDLFMGASGQMLILLRDEVSALDEGTAMQVFGGMINQVVNHFISKTKNQN